MEKILVRQDRLGHSRRGGWQDGFTVSQVSGMADIAKLLEFFHGIAREQGWRPSADLERYLECAVHFSLRHEEKIVGGLQMVVAAPSIGLPCQSVWPELMTGDTTTVQADIALLAIDKDYRRDGWFWLLCVEAWRYCRKHEIEWMWMEVPLRNVRLYRRFGWPIEVMGPERMHWGELCSPCRLQMCKVEATVVGLAAHSLRYRLLVEQAYRLD